MSQYHSDGTKAFTTLNVEQHAQIHSAALSPTTGNNDETTNSGSVTDSKPTTDQNLNDNAPLLLNSHGSASIPLPENEPQPFVRPPLYRRQPLEMLEYQTQFPITRYSRRWKRPEVQGFCCLAIEVVCLVTLCVLSLQAVGYFELSEEDDHMPMTFSWKNLHDFFTSGPSLPKQVTECLFSNLAGRQTPSQVANDYGNDGLQQLDITDYFFVNSLQPSSVSDDDDTAPNLLPLSSRLRQMRMAISTGRMASHRSSHCDYEHGPLTWLLKFLVFINFMPLLNIATSAVLYASLSVRRRKGIQVLLLLPSFFCFFVSVFQQIPTSFQYNYFEQTMIKEMRQALFQSNPPYFVVPILEETQFHRQCCGVENPSAWEAFGLNMYPPSCCNNTAFNCSKLEFITRKHVWNTGCFPVEFTKVHSFERWALLLYTLKVIAEVGIFCTLSDLTRFDYPPAEVQETSRCELRDYQIKCRGVMHIKGVTKDSRVVVETKSFLPWRLVPSRTDLVNGVNLFVKTDHNQIKGSVEVVKRHNAADNFVNEDIQLDLSRKSRGIFVFTLL